MSAAEEVVEVHRDVREPPYRLATRLTGCDTISPLAFPDVAPSLADIVA